MSPVAQADSLCYTGQVLDGSRGRSPALSHRPAGTVIGWALLSTARPNPTNSSKNEPMQSKLGTKEVLAEVKRIHEHWKAAVAQLNPDGDDPVAGFPAPWTWGAILQYAAFHVAYHTGQAYSVRHIFGHQTEDN